MNLLQNLQASALIAIFGCSGATAATVAETDFFAISGGGNTAASSATLTGFNVGAGTKLLVTAGTENSGGSIASVSTITFDGTALTPVEVQARGNKHLGLFILDGITTSTVGDIVVTLDGNGFGGFGVMTISGAQAGFVDSAIADGGNSGTFSASVGDLVVGAAVSNQSNALVPQASTTSWFTDNNVNNGGVSMAGAYFTATSTTPDSFTFTGGDTRDRMVGAVAFTIPEPSSLSLIGLGGLLLVSRRRR